MTTLPKAILIATAVALSFGFATVEPVKLSRKVKVGETYESKVTLVLYTSGLEINVDIKAREKVLTVKGDGSYVIEETQYDQNITVSGQAQPSPPDQSGEMTYSKTGEIVKVEFEQATDDTLGVANLMLIIWPTKPADVGSKWEADTKSGATIHHSYEILARETVLGRDTFKISLEAGGSSSGDPSGKATVWVDIENGQTVKANGEMKNVPTAGRVMDRITYTLTLVE